jgi:hypothetical protein
MQWRARKREWVLLCKQGACGQVALCGGAWPGPFKSRAANLGNGERGAEGSRSARRHGCDACSQSPRRRPPGSESAQLLTGSKMPRRPSSARPPPKFTPDSFSFPLNLFIQRATARLHQAVPDAIWAFGVVTAPCAHARYDRGFRVPFRPRRGAGQGAAEPDSQSPRDAPLHLRLHSTRSIQNQVNRACWTGGRSRRPAGMASSSPRARPSSAGCWAWWAS